MAIRVVVVGLRNRENLDDFIVIVAFRHDMRLAGGRPCVPSIVVIFVISVDARVVLSGRLLIRALVTVLAITNRYVAGANIDFR